MSCKFVCISGRKSLQFKKGGKDCVIDFDRMIQEEICSGIVTEVRRRPIAAINSQKRKPRYEKEN